MVNAYGLVYWLTWGIKCSSNKNPTGNKKWLLILSGVHRINLNISSELNTRLLKGILTHDHTDWHRLHLKCSSCLCSCALFNVSMFSRFGHSNRWLAVHHCFDSSDKALMCVNKTWHQVYCFTSIAAVVVWRMYFPTFCVWVTEKKDACGMCVMYFTSNLDLAYISAVLVRDSEK